MPYWSAGLAGIPNELLRSSLFNVCGAHVPRANLINHLVAGYDKSVQIFYTGQELRQLPDLDVFLRLLTLAQNTKPDTWVSFRRADMLRHLGWHSSKKDYSRLLDCLTRLNATSLRIHSPRIDRIADEFLPETSEDEGRGIAFSLVSAFRYENSSGKTSSEWAVKFDRELLALFKGSHYSLLSLELRQKLSPFGKWLHGYLSTHRQPWPFTLSMCIEKSGSRQSIEARAARMDWANKVLLPALAQLKAEGFLLDSTYDPKSEKVSVSRAPLFPTT
ncbi:hypothetical protein J1C54_08660 [Alcanivorax sp. 1008]|nr:hypothetical protein [Alcanivorax sp. 1008]